MKLGWIFFSAVLAVGLNNVHGRVLSSYSDRQLENALQEIARLVRESKVAVREADATAAPAPATVAAAEKATVAPVDEATEAPVVEVTEAPVDEATDAPVVEVTEAPVDEATTETAPEATAAPSDAKLLRRLKLLKKLLATLGLESMQDFDPFSFDGFNLDEDFARWAKIQKVLDSLPKPVHKTFSKESKIDGGKLNEKTKVDLENLKGGGQVFSFSDSQSFQKLMNERRRWNLE